MATSTPNYQFRKPADTDFVDESLDLNANWDIVDEELKTVSDRAFNSAYLLMESTTATSFTDSTDKKVNVANSESSGVADFTTSASVATVVKAGLYLVTACVDWNASGVGARIIKIVTNGTKAASDYMSAPSGGASGGNHSQSVSKIIRFSAGDTCQLDAWQSSGGALSCDATGNWLQIVKLSD